MDKSVKRLFPFVLRSRIHIVGRQRIEKSKHNLQWILITEDISENSESEILLAFKHYPVVKHFSSGEIEELLDLKGTKVVGFKKSDLAKSIYSELKEFRIN